MMARRPVSSAHALPDRAADRADARQAHAADPDRRRLDLRAEVGRLPSPRLPRWKRAVHPIARPQAAEPILSRARGAAAGARRSGCPVRARRRDRHRRSRRRARLRLAADPHPSGGLAREDAGRAIARLVRRLRLPGRWRSTTFARLRSASAGRACSSWWRSRRHRFGSRPRRPIRPSPRTGSTCSRVPGSTA